LNPEPSITYAFKGKNDPDLGPIAVLVSNKDDLDLLRDLMNLDENMGINLLMSRIFIENRSTNRFAIVGPMIGAPYTVMVLENLIVRGARQFIFLGWCGAVSNKVKIGDVIVPTSAIIDEGTSRHYADDKSSIARPSMSVVKKVRTYLNTKKINFHEGLVWTTDAIYRETHDKVEHFQKKDVLAVEMELSALFTVGGFRNVEIGGILLVSDELSTFEWKRGFHNKRFTKSRKAVAGVISHLCKNI
jgi:purine-nucleoside phosphorylase